jgi:hypothetical protein
MLQKLSQHIGDCYDRAADSKRRAERTTDFARKTELLDKIARNATIVVPR